MEAVSRLSSVWMSRSRLRRLAQVLSLCIVTFLLQPVTFSAAALEYDAGSLKAELFHREHPFSRLQSTSSIPLGSYAEKLQNDGKRSADRVKALVNKRRSLGQYTAAVASGSTTTLEATLSDAAPAEYVMSISLGTPPQNFVAVADTGSDLTWLQCKPCQNCFNQPGPVFDPSQSSTYRKLNCSSTGCSTFLNQYGAMYVTSCAMNGPMCEYSYLYDDMSNTTGDFSSETLNLKTTSGKHITVPEFWFGCSHSSFSPSALFDSTDGVVGLGQGLISFPAQLGSVFEDKFSYCLVNTSIAAVQSSPLSFGHYAVPHVKLQYTPMICNEDYPYYYYVDLEGISVGGVALDYNSSALALDSAGNGGTILDSGTTFTYLDPLAFDPLLAAIKAKFPSKYPIVNLGSPASYLELCYNVTGQPNYGNDLPAISLKLANHTRWDLAAANAWILLPDTPQVGTFTICLSIMRGSGGGVFSIIGNTQQQDFYVLYDRVDKKIGFAKTDCGSVSS
ncbi:unnamed protein product [Calypogeia fissa]